MPRRCDHTACRYYGAPFCLDTISTSPAQVLRLRQAAGLSQPEAARLVHLLSDRSWRRWEKGEIEPNETAIHLFALLTGQRWPR